jgi:5-methyltetrahydrofolate--homocysteine methyltransferase
MKGVSEKVSTYISSWRRPGLKLLTWVDIPPERFVKVVRKEKADLLMLSCLYTLTMHAMEDTIIALKNAGLKGKVKTIVGGSPITQAFADSIGADGFGRDAMDGVHKAKELVNGGQ